MVSLFLLLPMKWPGILLASSLSLCDTFHLLLSFLSSEQLTAQYIICEMPDRWIFTEFFAY